MSTHLCCCSLATCRFNTSCLLCPAHIPRRRHSQRACLSPSFSTSLYLGTHHTCRVHLSACFSTSSASWFGISRPSRPFVGARLRLTVAVSVSLCSTATPTATCLLLPAGEWTNKIFNFPFWNFECLDSLYVFNICWAAEHCESGSWTSSTGRSSLQSVRPASWRGSWNV